MWRKSRTKDDSAIVELCLALDAEDPGPVPVSAANMRRTLRALRAKPLRGRVLVLELGHEVCGYALVTSVWSNELGGLIDVIDELYVGPERRGQQHATRLIRAMARRSGPLASKAVALTLEVRQDNRRARRLYRRLGFRGENVVMHRRLRAR